MPLDPILKKRVAVPSSAAQFFDGYKIRPLNEQQKRNYSSRAQADALAAALRPYDPKTRLTSLQVRDSIDNYPGYVQENSPDDDPQLFELFGDLIVPPATPDGAEQRVAVAINVGQCLYQFNVNQGTYNAIRTEPVGERPVVSVTEEGITAVSWIR